jgi:hypothetical protein
VSLIIRGAKLLKVKIPKMITLMLLEVKALMMELLHGMIPEGGSGDAAQV